MGNKESQFGGQFSLDGREQSFDPNLIKYFAELRTNDPDIALEKFQIVRILSNLQQYRLLSSLYEKAMRFDANDQFSWLQFSLSLLSDRRFNRFSKILQQFISLFETRTDSDQQQEDKAIIAYMQLARLQLEYMGDLDLAESAAAKSTRLAMDSWLSGRCLLLLAMVRSLKAQRSNSFALKRALMAESIDLLEKAIGMDPHDDIAHLYCALEYANSRNLDMAMERCQTALNLNMENPLAIMLMALIFTARKDFKGALELVINALSDFPTHYGLLVLRLKLESKYGRVEEALQTSRNLIYFWHKTRPQFDCFSSEDENGTFGNGDTEVGSKMGDSTLTLGRQPMGGKEMMAPLTPLLTAPLGISATPTHLSVLATSNYEMTPCSSNDNLSTIGPPTQMSECGAPPSTDSLSILTSSSKSWISFSAFRIQADIWVELAEFFIEMDRIHDVQSCVEEACTIYPNSHQALHLKGHLYLRRAEKCEIRDSALSRRLKDEARNCFLGALSIHPGHFPSYSCLSKIYYMDGNLKMAEKMLRELMAIDPLNFQSWHDLGRILMELGRDKEALESFQMAASLDANTPLIPFQTIPRLLNPYFLK